MARVIRRVCSGFEAVEHVDRGLWQDQARRDPLAPMGDEENARASRPQRRRSFGEADPVGVGLDDGRAPSRRGAGRKCAPIVGERAKIDREAPRSAVEGEFGSGVSNLHIPM